MTHDQSQPEPNAQHLGQIADPRLIELSARLDTLGQIERVAMPEGLHERVVSGLDLGLDAQQPLPFVSVRTWKHPAMALALAAAIALVALPVWLNQPKPVPSPGPSIVLAAYTTEALDLFEVSTSALGGMQTTGVDALMLETEQFQTQIELEVSAWIDDPEAT